MTARWIAGLGYPALAVAYFDEPGQPTELETFRSIPCSGPEWLHAQAEVDADAVFTFGVSRGGELALWLAAEHPDLVAGAFAPVGSGYLVCGYPDDDVPAWTLGGQPLSPACTSERHSEPPAALGHRRVRRSTVRWSSRAAVTTSSGRRAPSWTTSWSAAARAETIAVPGERRQPLRRGPPGSARARPDVPVDVRSATHVVRTAFWDAVAEVLAARRGHR